MQTPAQSNRWRLLVGIVGFAESNEKRRSCVRRVLHNSLGYGESRTWSLGVRADGVDHLGVGEHDKHIVSGELSTPGNVLNSNSCHVLEGRARRGLKWSPVPDP